MMDGAEREEKTTEWNRMETKKERKGRKETREYTYTNNRSEASVGVVRDGACPEVVQHGVARQAARSVVRAVLHRERERHPVMRVRVRVRVHRNAEEERGVVATVWLQPLGV
jgi:hypothetical protein